MYLRFSTSLLAFLACALPTTAQVSFAEIEPNSNKADANLVSGIVPGDSITGSTTGTATGAGLTILTSADYYHLNLPPIPAGIYCYDLTSTTVTLTQSLRGLQQAGGVINAGTDTTFGRVRRRPVHRRRRVGTGSAGAAGSSCATRALP